MAPGLGKAKLSRLKAASFPSGRLGVLTPLASLSQWAVPRAHGPQESSWQTKPVAEPYLSLLACRPGVVCPGLSVFIASICAVLWACWPAASAPRLGATNPQQALPGPPRTTMGPSLHSWSRPLCPHPTLPHPSSVRPGPRMHRVLNEVLKRSIRNGCCP